MKANCFVINLWTEQLFLCPPAAAGNISRTRAPPNPPVLRSARLTGHLSVGECADSPTPLSGLVPLGALGRQEACESHIPLDAQGRQDGRNQPPGHSGPLEMAADQRPSWKDSTACSRLPNAKLAAIVPANTSSPCFTLSPASSACPTSNSTENSEEPGCRTHISSGS